MAIYRRSSSLEVGQLSGYRCAASRWLSYKATALPARQSVTEHDPVGRGRSRAGGNARATRSPVPRRDRRTGPGLGTPQRPAGLALHTHRAATDSLPPTSPADDERHRLPLPTGCRRRRPGGRSSRRRSRRRTRQALLRLGERPVQPRWRPCWCANMSARSKLQRVVELDNRKHDFVEHRVSPAADRSGRTNADELLDRHGSACASSFNPPQLHTATMDRHCKPTVELGCA